MGHGHTVISTLINPNSGSPIFSFWRITSCMSRPEQQVASPRGSLLSILRVREDDQLGKPFPPQLQPSISPAARENMGSEQSLRSSTCWLYVGYDSTWIYIYIYMVRPPPRTYICLTSHSTQHSTHYSQCQIISASNPSASHSTHETNDHPYLHHLHLIHIQLIKQNDYPYLHHSFLRET